MLSPGVVVLDSAMETTLRRTCVRIPTGGTLSLKGGRVRHIQTGLLQPAVRGRDIPGGGLVDEICW